MKKKIEIEISNEFLDKLLMESKNHNIQLEEYIVRKLINYEKLLQQMKSFNRTIKHDIEKIYYQIDQLDKTVNKGIDRSIDVISVAEYNDHIPKEFENTINILKKYYMLDNSNFFLAVNKNKIVGYIGIDYYKEPLPYGEYGFIFRLKLEDGFHTLENIKKFFVYLKSTFREKKIYNLDATSSSCQLSEEQLRKLGFLQVAKMKKIKILGLKQKYHHTTYAYKEIELELDWDRITDLLPANRSIPLKQYVYRWEKNKGLQQVKRIFLEEEKEIYIIRETNKDKKMNSYTPFLNPIDLFDKTILTKTYFILLSIISQKETINNITLEIPSEIEEDLKQHIDFLNEDTICWYRKILN